MKRKYPHWVCKDCGLKASKGKAFEVSTYHPGVCEVCLKFKALTEARDFGYPKFTRRRPAKQPSES